MTGPCAVFLSAHSHPAATRSPRSSAMKLLKLSGSPNSATTPRRGMRFLTSHSFVPPKVISSNGMSLNFVFGLSLGGSSSKFRLLRLVDPRVLDFGVRRPGRVRVLLLEQLHQ